MNDMKKVESLVAGKLLEIKAVKLQPESPFVWASGWKSPIYCDNRKTLSFPEVRELIKLELSRVIAEEFSEAEVVAGVATGAIAQGAMVASTLGKAFVYVRSTPKDHGLANLIEGVVPKGKKVVVVEDLISTGGSSLKAVEALREAGADVLGMVAIFTYGFEKAAKAFDEKGVRLITLSNYDALLDKALKMNYIDNNQLGALSQWRLDPENWGK